MKVITIRLTIGEYSDSRSSKYGMDYFNLVPDPLFEFMDCLFGNGVNAEWKLNRIEL